jgi:hypothetical protein
MPPTETFADAIAWVHLAFSAFVVLGFVVILVGAAAQWRWVRNPWFRWPHLGAIAFTAVRCWLNLPCPLTLLEHHLRAASNAPAAGTALHLAQVGVFAGAKHLPFTVGATVLFALTRLAFALYGPRRRIDSAARPRLNNPPEEAAAAGTGTCSSARSS